MKAVILARAYRRQGAKERGEEAHDGGQEIDRKLKMVRVGAVREPPLRRDRGGYFP